MIKTLTKATLNNQLKPNVSPLSRQTENHFYEKIKPELDNLLRNVPKASIAKILDYSRKTKSL